MKQRSILKEFAIGIVFSVLVVFVIGITISLFYTSYKARKNLEKKADERIASLVDILEIPLWGIDEETIRKIGKSFANEDLIVQVRITDGWDKVFYQKKEESDSTVKRIADIMHDNKLVGRVKLSFSTQYFDQIRKDFLWISGIIFLISSFFLLFLLTFFLRRFLNRPLQQLGEIVGAYTSGNYSPPEKKMLFIEFKSTIDLLQGMGEKIHLQMQDLNYELAKRKKVEKALRISEERLSVALWGANCGIWDRDLKTNKIFFDSNYFKIAGYEPNEFPHSYQEWRKRVHPDDIKETEKRIESYISSKAKEYEVEFRFKTKSNEWMWILSQGKIFEYDHDKNPLRFIGMHQDITMRKQAEKEKEKAQQQVAEYKKMALVGQVAGKMAHDFNNVLGVILGNTELSLLDCKDVETKKTLKLILEQTLRGKNLTKNLVAFAKDQEPKQELFNISEKIDLVIELMRKDLEDIELVREDKPAIPELLADSGMIEHAMVNLIQNSIHAISMVESPKIIIKTSFIDNNIIFEINDNGCGIPEEFLENIYEPSFTLKGNRDIAGSYKTDIKGTGYGMSNVKKYIELHSGMISVDSKIGSGTKFTISMPVFKKGFTKNETIELQEEILHFGKYILIVEDEADISNVQYKSLISEPLNHKVDIANDGKAGIDLFNRNEYDIVSLDYTLPGAINGMDVYSHIRKTNKKIPILFISGNIEFLESIKNLKHKDAHLDHLSKPCRNKEYVNSINKLIEKSINI